MFAPVPPAQEPTSEQSAQQAAEQELNETYALVDNLLDQNKNVEDIFRVLKERGLPQDEAVRLVMDLLVDRVNVLLDQDKHVEEIYGVLEDRGLSHDGAVGMVQNVLAVRANVSFFRKKLRKAGRQNIAIGGLCCLGGIIATIGGYAAAAGKPGATFVVFSGLIIFGAIQFFRGMGQVNQANH